MPKYDYLCQCGYREEQIRPVGAKVLACPACGQRAFRQQFPTRVNLATENEFARGIGRAGMETVGQAFRGRPGALKRLLARARRAGISVSAHDGYEKSIARFAEDPLAIVPHDRPRGHIKEVCRKTNQPCTGLVEHTPVEHDPAPETGPPLAEDIVRKLMHPHVRRDPGLRKNKAKLKKLREDVINKHAPVSV